MEMGKSGWRLMLEISIMDVRFSMFVNFQIIKSFISQALLNLTSIAKTNIKPKRRTHRITKIEKYDYLA